MAAASFEFGNQVELGSDSRAPPRACVLRPVRLTDEVAIVVAVAMVVLVVEGGSITGVAFAVPYLGIMTTKT